MKPKIIVYIALSLDGYIADSEGNVNWLGGQDKNYKEDYSYSEFIKEIDSIIMGRKTYESIIKISPNLWPYETLHTYVLTNNFMQNTNNITFIQTNLEEFLISLKEKSAKNIWICGGADIINQAMTNNLIDEYHLFIMPLLLGSGITLFQNQKELLELKSQRSENGVICAIYQKRIAR